MRIAKIAAAAVSVATLLLGAAHAWADTGSVKKLIETRFPELKVEKISPTNFGGLYEVFSGGEIFYTDEKAGFIVLGHILDTTTRENLTEARLRKLTAIPFDQLPLEMAVKTVRGNGAHKIAVFADPYCGYCKRFEGDLITLKDVTIYTFLYPILRPESGPTSKQIWCSADPVKAWQDMMIRGIAPTAEGTCKTPVDQVAALGAKLRINGTPTTFFEDGERISGAIPLENIQKKIAEASPAKK